jgi:DNA-binding transcriptional MerR regulator
MSVNGQRTYTVKEVSRLSGISVRAIRFFDEIGLLKPAFYGENGYRYYAKEQLLALQQILFYRELGIELALIQRIMAEPGFDKAKALRSHRARLETEAKRAKELILTIDKTLAHLEKETPMKDDELYSGFDPKKQAEYEAYLIKRHGEPARSNIAESKRRTKGWSAEDYQRVAQDYDELHRAFASALEQGLAPGHAEVQALVKRHYAVVNRFWTPTREAYIQLGKGYCEHPDFRRLYDSYRRGLAEYLAEAMGVYAERELGA